MPSLRLSSESAGASVSSRAVAVSDGSALAAPLQSRSPRWRRRRHSDCSAADASPSLSGLLDQSS